MLDTIDFDAITSETLQGLIANAVPEGWLYEYKRDGYGGNDEQTREFLKDVSCFANSHGGHLIIGMDEQKQLPVALSPLTLPDPEKEVARGSPTFQVGSLRSSLPATM